MTVFNMTWTLLIVVATGAFSPDVKMQTIPMKTEIACKAAALKLLEKSSKHVGTFCIGSETGEMFEVVK